MTQTYFTVEHDAPFVAKVTVDGTDVTGDCRVADTQQGYVELLVRDTTGHATWVPPRCGHKTVVAGCWCDRGDKGFVETRRVRGTVRVELK